MARVVLHNLTREFPDAAGLRRMALGKVSLEIPAGDRMVLLGPSGSGKSTLLRLIAGLDQPTSGSIRIGEREVRSVPPEARDVAMVFQNHALYPHLTAFENLALPLRLRGVTSAELEQRVEQAAAWLDVVHCLARRPAELSGGERQRIGLGRALIRRPGVLLLDEPLSNVDAPLRAQLRTEILALQSKLGFTMVYVTHDQEEGMALGGKLAVIQAGELQQYGEPLQIYRQPANRFVAGFVGWPPMNLLEGQIVRKGYSLFFKPGKKMEHIDLTLFPITDGMTASLKEFVDRPIILGLRPEALPIAQGKEPRGTTMRVVSSEGVGSRTRARLAIPEGEFTVEWPGALAIPMGESVVVAVQMNQAHFFDPATGRAIDTHVAA